MPAVHTRPDAGVYSRNHKRIFILRYPCLFFFFAFRLALLIHVHSISSACCLLAPYYLISHLSSKRSACDIKASLACHVCDRCTRTRDLLYLCSGIRAPISMCYV
jgi:hypothetical protein